MWDRPQIPDFGNLKTESGARNAGNLKIKPPSDSGFWLPAAPQNIFLKKRSQTMPIFIELLKKRSQTRTPSTPPVFNNQECSLNLQLPHPAKLI